MEPSVVYAAQQVERETGIPIIHPLSPLNSLSIKHYPLGKGEPIRFALFV
ncbi:hypothetical protein NF868_16895 [Bacillus zhangzhouensis]|nr:hypothetical protein NF868_16895 [Bacillus zhangzhouensis]